jgi:two-component system sensor histidine kinase HydH
MRIPSIHPLRTSAIIGLVYTVQGLLYIRYSGAVAARVASGSANRLAYIESIKGNLYILVTGLALFLFAWWLLKRIAAKEHETAEQMDALLQAERRATAGLYAASIAHDIRNILMVVEFNVSELAADGGLDGERQAMAKTALEGVEVIGRLSQRLLSIGKQELPSEVVRAKLGALARKCVDLAALHKHLKYCAIAVECPVEIELPVNAAMFQQMLFNLLLNAGEAMDGRGRILLRIERDGPKVVIEVHDSGPGFPAELRAYAFQPLFTTKASGSGLGLVSAKVFAEMHGGSIALCASRLGGAGFRIVIPDGAEGAGSAQIPASVPATNGA